ncbi:MAG: SGNH/GDSL hydrolase family protein [bacterium]
MRQNEYSKRPTRLRRFISDVAIAIGMSIAIIIVSEAFLRMFFPQNLVGTSIKGEQFSEMDEILGMRYVPGTRWYFTNPEYTVEYSINEYGFRDNKEHPVPKPEGTIRVLLVGDSFTFGQGVNYDQTWPVIVEKRLQESGNHHIDLVKAGIQGMDTRSEFILIKRLLEKYECDVVVVGFLINDLYTNTLYGSDENEVKSITNSSDGRILEKKKESADSWFKTAKQVFVRNDRKSNFHLLTLARRLAIANSKVYCNLYLAASNRRQWLTIPLPPKPAKKLEITKSLFEKIAAYCHSLGKKLIVLSIPQQFQVLYFDQSMKSQDIDVRFYDRYFTKIAKQKNFDWITTLDAFITSSYNKEELFYRLDGHLTLIGHQMVADVFLQEIVPMLDGTK